MTMERWEEESDEDYAERLSEEIAIADNTETTKYFFKTGYEEDEIILNYVGEDSWTWKNHPEGPFTAKRIIEWKKNSERWIQMIHAETQSFDTLEVIEKQIIEPQLKDSREYLDTHTKPEPHNVEMSRYWLEKGIYGTVSEINNIIRPSTQTAIEGVEG